MQLNEYQLWTRTTAIYPKEEAQAYLVLGLCSEAGEVAGKWKKFIRDGTINLDDYVSEIGDVFWYLARICDEIGMEAEDILEYNKQKLEDRKARNKLKGSGDVR